MSSAYDDWVAHNESLAEAQRIAHLGSWSWDIATNRVSWSDELFSIYGLDRTQFGASFEAFLERVHPEDRATTRARIEAALVSREPFDFQERIVRPDGGVRILRSRGRVVTDAASRVLRMVGTCLDITEEKAEAEAELRLQREQGALAEAQATAQRFTFLARASDVLASSLDYETTLRNVAALVVPAIADWCAIDLVAEDGTLQRLAIVHGDPERMRLAQRLRERYPLVRDEADLVSRVLERLEPELVSDIPDVPAGNGAPEGSRLGVLWRFGLRSAMICPLYTEGRALGVISLACAESGRRYDALDLSLAQELACRASSAIVRAQLVASLETTNARLAQRTQEIERARKAAEEASLAKSKFLTAMSHELRTPLNAIAGHAQLIEIGVYGAINDRQIEAVRRIQRNQWHLLALIDDILNFVRLEGGQIPMRLADLMVADVLAEIEPLIEPMVRARELAYRVEPADPSLRIRADREKLDQVLLNLLSNAIKATAAGGRITVGCGPAEGGVRIAVEDTGCGIPADKLDVIFEPFVQLGVETRLAGAEGIGLGLSISRNLARSMGGEIAVHSAVGIGSTFTVTLPAGQSSA